MGTISGQKTLCYLNERHLPDGGFFFARVEPSSGLETCLAVKTLRLLGAKTVDASQVVAFWEKRLAGGKVSDPLAAYLLLETYEALGLTPHSAGISWRQIEEMAPQTSAWTPIHNPDEVNDDRDLDGAMNRVSLIGRELETFYHLVVCARHLDVSLDGDTIAAKVVSLRQPDGGFGGRLGSQPLTVHHALAIFEALSRQIPEPARIAEYLYREIEGAATLECLFHAAAGLVLLGRPLTDIEACVAFLEGCRRQNGGFSRARSMGIATIEHTYMAVRVLKICEKQANRVFLIPPPGSESNETLHNDI